MSVSVKFGLLALISTAAAVPHSGHGRFHKPKGGYGGPGTGKPFPSGGWGAANSTAYLPTGTGISSEPTTTLVSTLTSTKTIVSTIYGSESAGDGEYLAPTPVAADVGAAPAACGPPTVYVTATNQVTVTVPADGAPPAPTPSASTSSTPDASVQPEDGYFILPVTSSLAEAPAPAPKPAPSTSANAPAEKPAPSASANAPAEKPAPSPSAEAPAQQPTPSAKASPAPPSTKPSGAGGKRGLAYNDIALCSAFAGKASWAWNWASAPGGDLPENVKFVPIAWGPTKITVDKWLSDVETAVKAGSDAVMGFNEPDHPDQANLSPGAACAAWKEYMNPIASAHPSVTIMGPSVTNAGPQSMNGNQNMGLTWLQQFQDSCPDAAWDAANIHFYDIYQEGEGQEGTVGRFISHIEDAAKQTGKPVYVTEFALNPGATPEQAGKFLKAVMQYMDGSDSVKGYSYFMVSSKEATMLNTASGLSSVGEIYAST